MLQVPVMSSFPLIVPQLSRFICIILNRDLPRICFRYIQMLREYSYLYLSGASRSTSAMKLCSSEWKPYNVVWKTVLKLPNDLLNRKEREQKGSRKRIDLHKGKNGGRMIGFFTETGILGMLEGNDYESIDLVSPLLREIVDVYCKNSKAACVTDVSCQYVDLVRAIRRGESQPGWTERKLSTLQRQIYRSKTRVLAVFGPTTTFKMRTSKWHALSTVVDTLRHLGSVEYPDAGVDNIVHELFKENI